MSSREASGRVFKLPTSNSPQTASAYKQTQLARDGALPRQTKPIDGGKCNAAAYLDPCLRRGDKGEGAWRTNKANLEQPGGRPGAHCAKQSQKAVGPVVSSGGRPWYKRTQFPAWQQRAECAKQDACVKSPRAGLRSAFLGQYRRSVWPIPTLGGHVKQSQFAPPGRGRRSGAWYAPCGLGALPGVLYKRSQFAAPPRGTRFGRLWADCAKRTQLRRAASMARQGIGRPLGPVRAKRTQFRRSNGHDSLTWSLKPEARAVLRAH